MIRKSHSHGADSGKTAPFTYKEVGKGGCPKCGGLLTGERFSDILSSDSYFSAVRCIQCGNRFDAVMLKTLFGLQGKGTGTR